jgi:Phage integrase, N-terminal SAM-like domain
MKPTDVEPVNELLQFRKGELADHSAFDVLANVSSEKVWLANFSSENTRVSYHRSIASFVATIGIDEPEELNQVKQTHLLAWRASVEKVSPSHATIAARLSALSSRYKHLTDEQLTTSNLEAGVRRPKTGDAGTGAGKPLHPLSGSYAICSMPRTWTRSRVCAIGHVACVLLCCCAMF